MTFVGMDLEQVRGHAEALAAQARQLESLVAQVDGVVDQASYVWPGPDSDEFRDTWFASYRPAVTTTVDQLAGAVMLLCRQIEQQAAVSGEPLPVGAISGLIDQLPGVGSDGTGSFPSIVDLLSGGMTLTQIGSSWASFLADIAETTRDAWAIENLPGGGFLAPALNGIGLGFSLSDLASAAQRNDLAGGVRSAIDVGMTVASAPLSLLWTGLSTEVGFFLPLNSEESGELLDYMQRERGMTPEQINERWSGVQGFINYGNDNVARQAPWLVDGADRLLEKPAEWLYNAGIRL